MNNAIKENMTVIITFTSVIVVAVLLYVFPVLNMEKATEDNNKAFMALGNSIKDIANYPYDISDATNEKIAKKNLKQAKEAYDKRYATYLRYNHELSGNEVAEKETRNEKRTARINGFRAKLNKTIIPKDFKFSFTAHERLYREQDDVVIRVFKQLDAMDTITTHMASAGLRSLTKMTLIDEEVKVGSRIVTTWDIEFDALPEEVEKFHNALIEDKNWYFRVALVEVDSTNNGGVDADYNPVKIKAEEEPKPSEGEKDLDLDLPPRDSPGGILGIPGIPGIPDSGAKKPKEEVKVEEKKPFPRAFAPVLLKAKFRIEWIEFKKRGKK